MCGELRRNRRGVSANGLNRIHGPRPRGAEFQKEQQKKPVGLMRLVLMWLVSMWLALSVWGALFFFGPAELAAASLLPTQKTLQSIVFRVCARDHRVDR